MTEPPPNALSTQESQPNRYHLFPAWLSLICPGLGQLAQGRVSAFFGHFTLWLLCLPSLPLLPFILYGIFHKPEAVYLLIPLGITSCLFITIVLFSVLDAAVWQVDEESYFSKRIRFLAWIAVPLGILFHLALWLPAVSAAREPARRMQCTNNIKHIGLALHNYHDVYHSFPPAYTVDENGKPLHSWRVLILPYLENEAIYKQIRLEEPWNSEHNRQFHRDLSGNWFWCPSWSIRPVDQKEYPGKFLCNYSVVVGEETLFPGTASTNLEDFDDTANTIMIVERYMPVNWMDPTQEISYETACEGINKDVFGVGSFHPGGANIVFADGSVRFLENDEDLTPYLKAKKLK